MLTSRVRLSPGYKKAIAGVFFVLLFFFINSWLNLVFMKNVMQASRAGVVERQFSENEGQLELLILGDSHTSSGINPQYLDHSFNFSIFGENYIQNYYRLKFVLKKNKKIKRVLLPLDLHSFSSWRSEWMGQNFYWIKYINYLEVGWQKKQPIKYLGKYLAGRFFSYAGEYDDVFSFLKESEIKIWKIHKGYLFKRALFVKKRRLRARNRARLHFFDRNLMDPDLVHYFKKIIVHCEREKIQLVLIKFPLSRIYYEYATKMMDPEIYYSQINGMIKSSSGIMVLDYHDIFFQSDFSFFWDPDHLNYAGARILSEKIAADLKIPGINPGNLD